MRQDLHRLHLDAHARVVGPSMEMQIGGERLGSTVEKLNGRGRRRGTEQRTGKRLLEEECKVPRYCTHHVHAHIAVVRVPPVKVQRSSPKWLIAAQRREHGQRLAQSNSKRQSKVDTVLSDSLEQEY